MVSLIFLMTVLNTIFIFLNHPLSMGMALIGQTIMIAIFSGLLLPSFWYSYILVLVFLGGLLILFIYVSTMAANEQIGAISLPLVALTLFFILFAIKMLIEFVPSEMFLTNDSISFKENYSWMFSLPSSTLAAFLMIYLFIVLMAIVKITKFWGGSIRPLS